VKVIAMAARKGGCGKTTLTTHLAVAGVQDGKRVAIIDLDPQSTAAEWSDGRGDEPPDVISTQPTRLGKVLAGMGDGYDLVLIDTPPTTGEADRLAIEAADLVLIPTRIQTSDIAAVLQSVERAAGQMKPTFVVFNDESAARRKSVAEETRRVLASKGIEVAPQIIHSRVIYGESQDVSRTALETDPTSTAAVEIRSLYEWVAKQLNGKATKLQKRKTGV
jgi:chromosome partitioning protein